MELMWFSFSLQIFFIIWANKPYVNQFNHTKYFLEPISIRNFSYRCYTICSLCSLGKVLKNLQCHTSIFLYTLPHSFAFLWNRKFTTASNKQQISMYIFLLLLLLIYFIHLKKNRKNATLNHLHCEKKKWKQQLKMSDDLQMFEIHLASIQFTNHFLPKPNIRYTVSLE